MAHAEICPVCYGSGKIGAEGPVERKTCHGCNGKGWVEIGSDRIGVPVQPVSVYPSRPTINISPWVYESGIYSANIEVLI